MQKDRRQKTQAAFTLIELLIVVAIIAILAAVAVPNFLEAQVRAKTSRAKNDIRTLITGTVAYAVDANKYPDLPDQVVMTLPIPARIGIPYSRRTLPMLSTPIAYITSGLLTDPFAVGSPATSFYGYANPLAISRESGTVNSLQTIGVVGISAADKNTFGENGYVFQSVGPDRVNFALAAPPASTRAAFNDLTRTPSSPARLNFYYDPTNGTVSGGDIVRSARYQN